MRTSNYGRRIDNLRLWRHKRGLCRSVIPDVVGRTGGEATAGRLIAELIQKPLFWIMLITLEYIDYQFSVYISETDSYYIKNTKLKYHLYSPSF